MLEELLAKIKPVFEEWLETSCVQFKVVGMGVHENPRWFQYESIHSDKYEEHEFVVLSSQSDLGFKLDLTKILDDKELNRWKRLAAIKYSEIYSVTREWKYQYMQLNHPTIDY